MNQMKTHAIPDRADEINLIELARKLIAHWPIIAVCMVLAGLGGLLSLRSATYTYTAELKVTPTQSSTQSSLQGLSSLASLAGVSMPKDLGATQFILYVEGTTSRSTADALAKQTAIMKGVFKSQWDEAANRFVDRPERFDNWTNRIKKLIGIPIYSWTPPDGAQLQLYLQDRLRITEDRVKPIVTLSYDNEDPVFAVAFLTALNKTVDDQLRQRTLSRVNENIAYLSRQLATITLTEHRDAIIQTLSEQEKTKMMASSDTPFAAEMIGVPSASFRPTKPNPTLIIVASILAGLLLGVVASLVREALSARERNGRLASRSKLRAGCDAEAPTGFQEQQAQARLNEQR